MADRIRGRRWMRIRRLMLAAGPVCAACGKRLAEEIDHILPLSRGGTNERKNLQCLCGPCHGQKTAFEKRGLSWRKVGRDGKPVHRRPPDSGMGWQ